MEWVREKSADIEYVGWKLEGRWHGLSSIRWLSTGCEYHGVFQNGLIDGAGKFVRPDGTSYIGPMHNGCPVGEGVVVDANHTRFRVAHDGRLPFGAGAVPLKEEEDPYPPIRPGQASAIALAVNGSVQTADGRWTGKYPNAKSIQEGVRLVFARPPYADVPLWNAEDVRGKIVAIMRGPGSGKEGGDPGHAVPFAVKVYHAQVAGAVGVIFMDNNRNASSFENLPRVDEGPLPVRVAVCCSVLQCVAVWCSVVQCGAVCCSVLQCVAVCCSVSFFEKLPRVHEGPLQVRVAVCCSML